MKSIIFLSCLLYSLSVDYVLANENGALLERKPQKIEDARPGNIRERIYQRLAKAQQFMSEEKYAESIEILDSLESISQRNSYALAQIYQTKGYVFAQQEDYQKAQEYFRKSLDLKALPLNVSLSTLYSLAQVTVAAENYKGAVPMLQDYIFNREQPNADVHFFYGQVLAQLDYKAESLAQVKKAISLVEAPKETWLRLLAALQFELKQYEAAAITLHKLIEIDSNKKEYWRQLASIYMSEEKEVKALATLELAYKKGFLKDEKDLLQLVQFSIYQGIPYKGAVLLEKALKKGLVNKTSKNFSLLADAWTRAQEVDEALTALEAAAPIAEDGSVYVRQGQLWLEKENWQRASDSLEAGIKKGKLKKAGLAYIALGIAQFKLGKTEQAIDSFAKAQKFDRFKKQAVEWMSHVKQQDSATF